MKKKLNVIALVDCDSFFVGCEMVLNPELRGKAVCVLSNNDACVVARSKEAKKLGVRMGMSMFMAKREFPDVIYLSGNIEVYKKISKQVMNVLREFSPAMEQYSVDEAFIDLTGLRRYYRRSYLDIAKLIKKTVKEQVGIDVSVGVSFNKTLAKLASHIAKKTDGTTVIGKYSKIDILKDTEIEEIWGVGRNISVLFRKNGIRTAYDIIQLPDKWLKDKLGNIGIELKKELQGQYVNKLSTKKRIPKSLQDTSTFPNFTSDKNFIKSELNFHIHKVCSRLRKHNLKAKNATLILKTKDFRYFCEKMSLKEETNSELEIEKYIRLMLEKIYNESNIYRSSGLCLDGLCDAESKQLSIFNDNKKNETLDKLGEKLDKLEQKFGKNIVKTGFFNAT